jgi:uncharacterized coiled-coil DUF342 family protein
MDANFQILEDRVLRVVERLRELESERGQLRDELDGLRRTLADLREENNTLSGGLPSDDRRTRIRRIESTLGEAVEALREESIGIQSADVGSGGA